jgi:hypothetical protein
VGGWLRERGEPFETTGSTVHLRALAMHVEVAPDQASMKAQLDVSSMIDLTRAVDLIFDLSVRAGADVRLSGVGEVTRGGLWVRLADEQDRLRIAEALDRADQHGNREEVGQRLWQVVAALRPGHDDRWDAAARRIVELREVGAADGISLQDACWHADNPKPGDVIAVDVPGSAHSLAWRWLSEAYPGLAETDWSFH